MRLHDVGSLPTKYQDRGAMIIGELMYWRILTIVTVIGFVFVTITAIYEIKKAYGDRVNLGELERLDQEVIDELLYFYKRLKIHEGIELKYLMRHLK